MTKKELALKFVDGFQTGNEGVLDNLPEDFRLHRPEYPTGKDIMAQYFFTGQAKGSVMENKRVFQDGGIVVTHNYSYNYADNPPIISFDIFGIEDELIIDYWDNMTFETEERNNEHTQYDGAREVTDLDKTDNNKALVKTFAEKVYLEKNIDAIDQYVNGNQFIQHNPYIADGSDALKLALANTDAQYTNIERILGEGNFVLVIAEGTIKDTPTAFFDLYRLENNLIVEHWDVIESIAPKEKWENENGKLNFKQWDNR